MSVIPNQRALPFFAGFPATIVIFGLLIRPAALLKNSAHTVGCEHMGLCQYAKNA
jgi:hypothetical protein